MQDDCLLYIFRLHLYGFSFYRNWFQTYIPTFREDISCSVELHLPNHCSGTALHHCNHFTSRIRPTELRHLSVQHWWRITGETQYNSGIKALLSTKYIYKHTPPRPPVNREHWVEGFIFYTD